MRALFSNSLSNVLLFFVRMIITFVMTPVYLKSLGNYDYGIWEIVSSVVGYMGFLDLGVKSAIVRYTSMYSAKNEEDKLPVLYLTSMIFMVGIGVLLALSVVFFAISYPDLLSEGGGEGDKYRNLLLIVAAQILVVFTGMVFQGFLEGLQKYRVKNNIQILVSLISAVVLYNVLGFGDPVVVLAMVFLVGSTIKNIIYLIILLRSGRLSLSGNMVRFSSSQLKELISFGMKSLVRGVTVHLERRSGPVLVSIILGVSMVPFYAIPAAMLSYVQSFGFKLTEAFMPFFSEAVASGNTSLARKTYIVASKYVIAETLLLVFGIVFMGEYFIQFWVGEEYAKGAFGIIIFLALYHLLYFIIPFSNRYLTAIGKHGIYANVGVVSAAVNILASFLLGHIYGVMGVAAGAVFASAISIPIYLVYTCKHLDISVSYYLKVTLMPLMVPVIGLTAILGVILEFVDISGFIILFSAAGVAGLVFVVLVYFFAATRAEQEWAKKNFIKFKSKLVG